MNNISYHIVPPREEVRIDGYMKSSASRVVCRSEERRQNERQNEQQNERKNERQNERQNEQQNKQMAERIIDIGPSARNGRTAEQKGRTAEQQNGRATGS
jgi:hypothetical protein